MSKNSSQKRCQNLMEEHFKPDPFHQISKTLLEKSQNTVVEEASTKWKLFTISALLRTWFDPLWLILWLWWTKASALLFYEWSISTLVTTFEKTIKHIDRFDCTELLRNRVNIQYFFDETVWLGPYFFKWVFWFHKIHEQHISRIIEYVG